jgi:RNA polymerase sigma factor (TIGR02999 family)
MSNAVTSNLTLLLNAAGDGDSRSASALLPIVYEELRTLAHRYLSREPAAGAGQTLQATALVHEAYLRLVNDSDVRWNGRNHFFGAAGLAMRRILVERARSRRGPKRGSGKAAVELGEDAALTVGGEDPVDWIALDSALEALELQDPRLAELVSLRYFAGLSVEQTAQVMDLSGRQVKRDWAVARAWLYARMEGSGATPEDGGGAA